MSENNISTGKRHAVVYTVHTIDRYSGEERFITLSVTCNSMREFMCSCLVDLKFSTYATLLTS